MSQTSGHYKNSALIVWDMQYGIAPRAFNFVEIVANITRLIDAAHTSNVPVIYSQHTGVPFDYMSKYQVASLQRRGLDPKSSSFMLENSKEWRIIDELRPTQEKHDLIVRKHTASFFVGTMLDSFLRVRNVETMILAGVSTDAGIEGTARHASYIGYIPVIIEDAVGSSDREMHDASLKIMRRMFEVRRTDEIIKIIP